MPWRSRGAAAIGTIKNRLKKCAKSGERPVIPIQQKTPIFFPFLALGLSLLLRVEYAPMVLVILPRCRRCSVATGEPTSFSSVGTETRLDLCACSRTIYIRGRFIEHLKILFAPTRVFSTLFFNQICYHKTSDELVHSTSNSGTSPTLTAAATHCLGRLSWRTSRCRCGSVTWSLTVRPVLEDKPPNEVVGFFVYRMEWVVHVEHIRSSFVLRPFFFFAFFGPLSNYAWSRRQDHGLTP